ncbi:MAG TPA: M1 family aminopeptidase [Phycisphaerales bacterium]|nr:M1 family aminopeptidase [Phycisphaerales bacterium]
MNPFRRAAILALACAWGLVQPHARADQPVRRAFDPATGRNLLNYPPHKWADIRHTRLQLRIPDMNDRTILASETLTVASPTRTRDLADIRLDAGLLQISAVSAPGRICTLVRDAASETVVIHLDPPLPAGQTTEVTIDYRISDPPDGLVWTTESPAHPGRAAQLYSQGESDSNHYWFACHDSPNARATSELIATVPRGFRVVSNGRLESVKRESLEPFDTFHWIQDRPHAAYLVSLVVGKFDTVDVGSSKLPMPVYVPPGQAANARTTFARTPKMVSLLERLTDQPYPWAKYAQVSVWNFGWGGMENTSATTLYESIAQDETAALDGDEDDLIVHELAHQWFGDLLTCKSWEHVWLNEGFATYCEALWLQYKGNGSVGRSDAPTAPTVGLASDRGAYDAQVWEWIAGVIADDRANAPFQPAMVSKEYDTPDEVFDRKANPYSKGALVLHMLRARLGDEVFFRGLRDFVQRHRFTAVETYQFRQAMERVSGESLQRFFDQWCYRPGVPRVSVSHAYENGTLRVSFEQLQTIDGYNPAFDLRVPVWVLAGTGKDGRDEWARLEARFDTKTFELSAPLAGAPRVVLIDPELTVLADFDARDSARDLASQLASAPTLGARLRAAKGLRSAAGDVETACPALAAVLTDASAPEALRIACAKSLASLANPRWVDPTDRRHGGTPAGPVAGVTPASRALRAAMDSKSLAEPRLRAAVIDQCARAAEHEESGPRAALADRCSRIFNTEQSYAVRAAAVRALGTLGAIAERPTILKALNTDSHRDQIRQGAIQALADLDTPDSLSLVLMRTAPDNSSFVRAAATAALADLAHHDPDRVFSRLASLLDDREPRTAQAAGTALSEIGGQKVRVLFEGRLEALRSRSQRGQTRVWLRDLPAAPAPVGENAGADAAPELVKTPG